MEKQFVGYWSNPNTGKNGVVGIGDAEWLKFHCPDGCDLELDPLVVPLADVVEFDLSGESYK